MDPAATSSPPSNGDLARAIVAGDPAAESALYDRFAARVHYIARRELRLPDLADDARSETFLRVLQAIRQGRLREADSLAAFVLQTTRNVIREIIRGRTRGGAVVDAEADVPDVPADAPLAPEIIEAVRGVIRELSPRDRAFLKMHYYDELSKEDISRRLGVAPERVRLIKSRALQRLRRAFAEQGLR